MYVCVCNAINEHHIHQAVRQGAKTIKHLRDQLGVGRECGRCVSCAKACIRKAEAQQSSGDSKSLIKIATA